MIIFEYSYFPVLPELESWALQHALCLSAVSYHVFSAIRRKSKQAMRDYKKVQIQLENLETSVRDRCKKEFTGREKKEFEF